MAATLIDADLEDSQGVDQRQLTPQGELVQWVMTRVDDWKNQRDQAFSDLWNEYYRLWRGRWTSADKNRNSERSRIVTPALAQAIEMTVAELEEAAFGREVWVQILGEDGSPDANQQGAIGRKLLTDLAKDGAKRQIAIAMLIGALYGTLAAKVVVEEATTIRLEKDQSGNMAPVEYPKIKVYPVAIPCTELVPDPEAEDAVSGLGIAHDCVRSKSFLLKYDWGREYALTSAESIDPDWTQSDKMDPEDTVSIKDHSVRITEWHGMVPERLINLPPIAEAALVDTPAPKSEKLVEAIVIIADGSKLLKGIENPFFMKDRSIVACQFELVPGKFWGRGVSEKGYNPQKALDGELRMRMDVMGIIGNPMLAIDGTAMPRGFDMRIRPGKTWLTNGNPKEALTPIVFPGLDPASFNQTAELERMVQMGTGALDSATPLAENRRNETLGGTSIIAGTFVKRTKRALRRINEDFIEPIVQKIVWRKLQYDPQRYQADFEFRVIAGLGIVAREVEGAQMIQMAGMLPPGSPAQLMATKALFDLSASPFRDEMMAAIDQMMQPDPKQQQTQEQAQQIALATAVAQLEEHKTTALKNLADVELKKAQAFLAMAQAQTGMAEPQARQAELQMEFHKIMVSMAELEQYKRQVDVSAIKAQADLLLAKKKGSESSAK